MVPDHAPRFVPVPRILAQYASPTIAASSTQSFNPPVRRSGAQEFLDFLERLVLQQLGVRQGVFHRLNTSLRLGLGNSIALR